MQLIQDLRHADHIASVGWWRLAKYVPYAIIEELEAAYADLQEARKKHDKSQGLLKKWHLFWLLPKASQFVAEYGKLCTLAAQAH